MLHMKQTQTIISTYTADVSGVCSALFELGGMTVMHDASGCNSTYNTHDEPRWYDHDSLVFISGLSEIEAIMGDDEKLIHDIADAAAQLSPRFIAVAGTPIPMMTGCDIPAIAADIENRTGIPCFGFQTNGMHSYVSGAGMALAAYADRFVRPCNDIIPGGVNILGVTPLDFSVGSSAESMQQLLTSHGFCVISTWAMNSTPEQLSDAAAAQVNLVVSAVGLETAELLRRKFGTPYVIGTPYGKMFSDKIIGMLDTAAKTDPGAHSDDTAHATVAAFGDYTPPADAQTVIIGEGVMSRSLAAARYLATGEQVRVICPLEISAGLLSSGDSALDDEQDIKAALVGASMVIADPLYRPIVPPHADFIPLPHEAFSGRIFRKSIPDLIKNFKI